MKDLIIKTVADVAQNPKVAVTVATVTAANGLATWQDILEQNIGVWTSLIGLLATIIMLGFQIRKFFRDEKEHRLKILTRQKYLNEN